jgi:hypothetical protein
MTAPEHPTPWLADECPRHGSWTRQPGSAAWSLVQQRRYGGGAQHRCSDCGLWVYCADWPNGCPEDGPLDIYDRTLSKHPAKRP